MYYQHLTGVNTVLFVLDWFYTKWKFLDTHSFRNNEYIVQVTLKDAGVNIAQKRIKEGKGVTKHFEGNYNKNEGLICAACPSSALWHYLFSVSYKGSSPIIPKIYSSVKSPNDSESDGLWKYDLFVTLLNKPRSEWRRCTCFLSSIALVSCNCM